MLTSETIATFKSFFVFFERKFFDYNNLANQHTGSDYFGDCGRHL